MLQAVVSFECVYNTVYPLMLWESIARETKYISRSEFVACWGYPKYHPSNDLPVYNIMRFCANAALAQHRMAKKYWCEKNNVSRILRCYSFGSYLRLWWLNMQNKQITLKWQENTVSSKALREKITKTELNTHSMWNLVLPWIQRQNGFTVSCNDQYSTRGWNFKCSLWWWAQME
jgi:hypothetical protein